MPGTSNVSERAEGDPPEPVSEEHQAKIDEMRRRLAAVEREREEMATAPTAPAGWDRIEGGVERPKTMLVQLRNAIIQALDPILDEEEANDSAIAAADAVTALIGESGPAQAVPAGWDRIEGDDEADPGAEADRELERMSLENDARALDLREAELAFHEMQERRRMVADADALRVEALNAARNIAVMADGDASKARLMANATEAMYRRFLGLIEKNGTNLVDGQTG